MSAVSPESPVLVAMDMQGSQPNQLLQLVMIRGFKEKGPLRRPHLSPYSYGFWLNNHWLSNRFTGLESTYTTMPHKPSSSWDKVTHDDIFLEAAQEIDFAECRCLG